MSPDLIELREFHLGAAERLKAYAEDHGLREPGVKHYIKRSRIYRAHATTIEEVLTLGQV